MGHLFSKGQITTFRVIIKDDFDNILQELKDKKYNILYSNSETMIITIFCYNVKKLTEYCIKKKCFIIINPELYKAHE